MPYGLLMKLLKRILKTLCGITLLTGIAIGAVASEKENRSGPRPKIVTIDMSYELFMALASYQELSEAERAGKNIHREMAPVINVIITKLRSERDKIKRLKATLKGDRRLDRIESRLDQHISGFAKELLYRQKVLKYESLMKEQRRILKSQP